MRIQTSEHYHHGTSCDVADCQRRYCNLHRILWNDCDTAVIDWSGAGQRLWMLNDCPACMRDNEKRKQAQFIKDHEHSIS